MTTNQVLLAGAAVAVGAPALALATLDGIPADRRDAAQAPEIRRIRGDALVSQGKAEEALSLLREAITIARRRSVRMLELRATVSLARVLIAQGRRDEARRELGEIYARFNEGFDTVDLKEAKGLLDQLA
jgi:hypothetical protein